MKALVTGGTGFVGRAVVRTLESAGHESVIASRNPPRGGLTWDPMAGPPPAGALDGVEAVVHLAGESVSGRWTPGKRRSIHDSRIVGTRHLVDGILGQAEPPRVLVSASAIGYYGDRDEEVLTEESGRGQGFLADVCHGWESEAARAREAGTRVVSARIGIVLGRGGGALERMIGLFRLGLGGRLGSGRQWWSWVHLDDVAGAILHAIEGEVDGPLNVVAPHAVRQAEFARALGRQVRRPAVLPVPATALRMTLGGFSSELLSSKHTRPARLEEAGYDFRHATLDQALAEAATPP
jgi:uncharacterized protein (TIGR01777 family)